MGVRKFRIINKAGQIFDLSGNIAKLTDPTGLGFQNEFKFTQIDYFYKKSKTAFEQSKINGNVYFIRKNNCYADYQAFIDFINANELKLEYTPRDLQPVYMDIEILSVEKSEQEKTGWLKAPIAFIAKTPWYKGIKTNITVSTLSAGKKYSYKYGYRYTSTPAGTVDILVNGHFPAAFTFTANGAFANPIIKLIEANTGNIIGNMELTNVTVAAGSKLEISQLPTNPYVRVLNADGSTENLREYLNIENINWFTLPLNTPCKFEFSAAGAELNATLVINEYYKSR